MDLGSNPSAWNTLSWTASGLPTGNGEVPFDTSSLVAQWNFNETSGTTADNAEGTSSLDGTLTGFSSTSSQDSAAATGWTFSNRRWGAGALMFDGSNDYVALADNASFKPTTAITIEAWIKPNTLPGVAAIIIDHQSATPYYGYSFWMMPSGKLNFQTYTGAGPYTALAGNTALTLGSWHHVVAIYDGTVQSLYVDGKIDGSEAKSGTLTYTASVAPTIGSNYSGTNYFFTGTIDALRLYSRALSAAEILSNYNSTNLDMQTRSSSDGSTWEAWKPYAPETAIASYDGPYMYPISESGLVSYWPMDEPSGANVDDPTGNNDGTATGTTVLPGQFANARTFNGSSDYVSMGDTASLDITGNTITLSCWVKISAHQAWGGICGKGNDITATSAYQLMFNNTDNSIYWTVYTTSGGSVLSTKTISDGEWHHVVGTYDGSLGSNQQKLYIDGALENQGNLTGNINNSADPFMVGRYNTAGRFVTGVIDEVKVYNTALSAATIQQQYLAGSSNTTTFHPSTDTVIKQEGSASQKISLGSSQVDSSTIGYWHLDETGGTGAYLKDASNNANHATPTGTTPVDGISSKACSFNGSSDKVSVTNSGNFDLTTYTWEAWIQPTWVSGSNGYNPTVMALRNGTPTRLSMHIRDNYSAVDFFNGTGSGTVTYAFAPNQWSHIAMTYNSGTIYFYVNGIQINSTTSTQSGNTTLPFVIGSNNTGEWFKGTIDEVKVSSVVKTADEIAENYRIGRDHRVRLGFTATDLSSATRLPFYIASDRVGTPFELTIGESAFANGDPDPNTVGLWHLDEAAGSGAYLKDSSGYGNHGTPTSTTSITGKTGKGRYFNGSSYIAAADSDSLDLTTAGTISVWAYKTSQSYYQGYISKAHTSAYQLLDYDTTGRIVLRWGSDNDNIITDEIVPTGQWTHVVGVYDGSYLYIYINGRLSKQQTYTTNAVTNTTAFRIGARDDGYYFNGNLDEARVDNIARTADEIRQAYEMGKRSHQVTIDFKSSLNSNLITSSGDLSFTITDASHLFLGDKVIVKENYDGTEYRAQGAVDTINSGTGAVTVASWDSGSTFASGGYTANATVFKWQREYMDLTGSLSTHRDAVTQVTLRSVDGSQGGTFWLDDLKSSTPYLNTPAGSTVTSTLSRYFQYRSILSSSDSNVSAILHSVSLDYNDDPLPADTIQFNNVGLDNVTIN
jgi:hypothetical protein